MTQTDQGWILTLSCKDAIGITFAVTQVLVSFGGNVTEAQQFHDPDTGGFFMRIAFTVAEPVGDTVHYHRQFDPVIDRFAMEFTLRRADREKRVLLFVSKFDHCLTDLLYRMRIGELRMDVRGIISNHPKEALNLTNFGDVPYHHLPVTQATKAEQEAKIAAIAEQAQVELVVLARYMQILSPDLVSTLTHRCINIHHSFLPSFKGARPYHKAYQRGVKMIGATAHFVTNELDEGPIIAQDVEHVTHADAPADLIRKGRNIEQRVLARAVELILQDRVLVNRSKTVVFSR